MVQMYIGGQNVDYSARHTVIEVSNVLIILKAAFIGVNQRISFLNVTFLR